MRILSRSADSIELEGPLLERVGSGLVEVRNRSKQWTGIPVDWSASGLKRSLAPRLVVQVERGALNTRTGSVAGESARAACVLPWLADALTRAGVVSLTPLPTEQSGGAARSEATNLLGEPIELIPLDDWFVATLALDAEVADVVDRVRSTPGVREAAEDAWSYVAHLTPNDPRFAQQWGLRNLGGTVCGYTAFGTVDVGAASAWDQTTGSPGVRMAILDSGINPDHEDFGPGRVRLGPDYSTGGGGVVGTAYDLHGHGTAVAGIAAALGNNGAGVAGVDWQVQPWAVRVLDQYLGGNASQLGQGIQWATDQWMPILNMSLGWSEATLSPAQHNLLADKTLNAFKRGLFLVASSGNTEEFAGRFDACPADLHRRVYAVGAFLPNGQRWQDIAELGVTNCPYFDPCMASNYGPFLDAMAPGGRLIATTGLGSTEYHDLSGCVTGDRSTMAFGGTSAAAPVVSGIAALLMSRRPDLIGEDIAQILNRTTAGPYVPGTWTDEYGWGRVKASSALNFVGPGKVVAHWSAGPSSNTLGPLVVTQVTPGLVRRFRDVPGMPTNDYTTTCVRYRLQAVLEWPFPFAADVVGWARSSGTLAWKDIDFYDYRAEVDTATFVPSTFGTTGVTVEAFVFQVMNAANPSQTIGWFPTDPEHARVALTVIGSPAGTTDVGPATVAANLVVTTLPNPSRGAMRMVVDVPTRGRVRATVLDLAGRRVATLVERELEPGRHEFRWDGITDEGGRCGAGVYFCRVDCGGIATIKRFIRLGGN